ncbi:FAD-binding oxidoreductase [Acetobacter sp. AN02]|uniref:NAD(P)/FAD-dependent oxidoreductase n=1 Tax=Acetobacter sp. AN02 TaxID=2894186 RepID=UPI0024340FBC|nr:FAD-binding oxidoreductase [Acetobacter sp. AN02]MDG6094155.1 FAD-binding oxidoreductase [Acetobacter sp. AN02]
MSKSVLVLGGGMIGTTAAWYLRRYGFDVTLIERGEIGGETSYGNVGLIQTEAAEPYAFPHDLRTLARVITGVANEARWSVRDLPAVAWPLARYWYNSFPGRYARISRSFEAMIRHSTEEHEKLLSENGGSNLIAQEGWKQILRSERGMDQALARARRVSSLYGIPFRALDPAGLAREEPELKQKLAGAIWWTSPWSASSPGQLVQLYARLFTQAGGTIVKGDARSLSRTASGWSVRTENGLAEARHAVLALGPWTDDVAGSLGYRFPFFVKRGYHRHFSWSGTIRTPMIDTENGVAMASMQQGLRIATGAEFALRDSPSDETQIRNSEKLARQLLDFGTAVEQTPWRGARPCLPDMLPVIGPAPKHDGLWFSFGHGHQGFTLGPASGRLLAEQMSGETPFIDPSPYFASRFRGAL